MTNTGVWECALKRPFIRQLLGISGDHPAAGQGQICCSGIDPVLINAYASSTLGVGPRFPCLLNGNG